MLSSQDALNPNDIIIGIQEQFPFKSNPKSNQQIKMKMKKIYVET